MYALTAKGSKFLSDYTRKAGISSQVLMENAAKGVAEEINKRFKPSETRILVICGPGNNGGDAICAARWLLHFKFDVEVYFIGKLESASQDFVRQVKILAKAFPRLEIAGMRGEQDRSIIQSSFDVVIDGVFGTGFAKELDYETGKFLEYINSKDCYRVALDLPSGLNPTTGVASANAFKADLTITFGNYKTGMLFGSGKGLSGEVKVVDVGFLDTGYKSISDKLVICDNQFFDDTAKKALRDRPEDSHKGTFGSVGIAVSTNGMLGASILAAKAAYRVGCGTVKVFCPSKVVGFFNVSVPEAVVVPYKSDDILGAFADFAKGVDCILIGPGLSEDNVGRLLVKHLLSSEFPVVFDAGALSMIAKNLKLFKKRKCPCIITPHIGEMAKLCNEDINVITRNRIAYTKKFSEKFEVSMTLKSDASLISLISNSGKQKLFINTMGNSGLATAGSGDVLAGVIASLLAQGNTINNSLLYGVMIHARSADRYAKDPDLKRKMMASDIIDNLF